MTEARLKITSEVTEYICKRHQPTIVALQWSCQHRILRKHSTLPCFSRSFRLKPEEEIKNECTDLFQVSVCSMRGVYVWVWYVIPNSCVQGRIQRKKAVCCWACAPLKNGLEFSPTCCLLHMHQLQRRRVEEGAWKMWGVEGESGQTALID